MEMSGNVWEQGVTVGNSTGEIFTGTHGNGVLGSTGDADASTWPGMDAVGAGLRGGAWSDASSYAQVSDRVLAAYTTTSRDRFAGGRGVRSVPGDSPASNYVSLVSVSGGTFTAGSTVTTISSFSIGKYEVTYDLWTAVRTWGLTHGYTDLAAGVNGSVGSGTNMPVTTVNHYDVMKWCNARSEKEGLTPVYYTSTSFIPVNVYKTGTTSLINTNVDWTANGYRLPTEAEWEFAAKGGVSSKGYTYSGSSTVNDVAWWHDNSTNITHTVGGKAANELGIYDMTGNVWEWCWDWYDNSNAYPVGGTTNPQGPAATQTYRVLRGGSYVDPINNCRSVNRDMLTRSVRYSSNGFRCVQH
jgi:formylglycine-generating enzyme